MSQKPFSRTVHQDGNSKAVTLPSDWADAFDVDNGDELQMSVDGDELRFAASSD